MTVNTIRLSDRALLVSLSISQWSARKFDKNVTSELQRKHNTAEGMARVNKLLLPKDSALDKVHKKAGEIRTAYYAQTLPWATDGSRILPSAHYLTFVEGMRKLIDQWHRLKSAFLDDYPSLREEARTLLNGMYDESDYPSLDEVRHKFDIRLEFFPIPDTKDFRRTLLDEEAEAREREMEETYKRVTAQAMHECWQRLYDVVARAVERLSNPDNIFRDSLVENAKELCRLLPKLNITDDPNLERMRQEVERTLAQQHPETLRRAPEIRAEVASQMKSILDKMGAFYQAA